MTQPPRPADGSIFTILVQDEAAWLSLPETVQVALNDLVALAQASEQTAGAVVPFAVVCNGVCGPAPASS